MKRAGLLTVALLCSLLLGGGTAAAKSADVVGGGVSQSAQVKGGSATCTPDRTLSHLSCDVTDSDADKSGIYVSWESTGESGQFRNKHGAGHTEHYEKDLTRGVDTSTLRWKVCRDEALSGDDCSDWKKHAVGPNGGSIELQCEFTPTSPTCYLPENGLDKDAISSDCLATIAQTAAGLADAKGEVTKKIASRIFARFVPGVGWAVTVIGVGQGIAQCT